MINNYNEDMIIPNTQKNEKRLQRVLKIVVSATDLTPEFKLAFKAYINETISDIRERGIASYHDLIDYLREKAEQGIDGAEMLSPEQKISRKCLIRLLAELAKLRRCNRKSFWPGTCRGRIKAS